MKSILIAEGDPNVAKLFASVFRQSGWRVASPFDANGVLKALGGTEHFDIMLISSRVRGSDGIELIKFARSLRHRKHLRVLMVTGTGGMETEAFAAGADEVLHKPIGMDKLVAAADKHLVGVGQQAKKA
jgi:DNA-binding response OmpR family regulator